MPHYYIDNSVLVHFGVKGMRWGVRKAEQLQGIPRTTVRAAKKDAKLLPIGPSGHVVMADQPTRFNAALGNFLKGV